MRGTVEKNQGAFQRTFFGQLGKTLSGKCQYKNKRFTGVDELVNFLNDNKHDCVYVAVVPDFQSYSYILIYEKYDG